MMHRSDSGTQAEQWCDPVLPFHLAVRLLFSWWQRHVVAARLFYITGCAPTVYELPMTERGTHDQTFPQKGGRIISDSGCLGAHALTIRWLWDLKGMDNFHWALRKKVEKEGLKTTPSFSNKDSFFLVSSATADMQNSRLPCLKCLRQTMSSTKLLSQPLHNGGTRSLLKYNFAMSIPAVKHKYRLRNPA